MSGYAIQEELQGKPEYLQQLFRDGIVLGKLVAHNIIDPTSEKRAVEHFARSAVEGNVNHRANLAQYAGLCLDDTVLRIEVI
jgi:hypothetical protein